MISPKEIMERVAADQERFVDDPAAQRRDVNDVRARLFTEADGRTAQTRPRRLRAYALAAAATALAASVVAALLYISRPQTPASLESSVEGSAFSSPGAWYSSTESTERQLSFIDGSAVLLMQGSGMRVIETSKDGARVSLEYGEAKVNVPHGGALSWTIDAGPFSIRVVGTAFSIVWDPSGKIFELRMERGKVDIGGPLIGRGRRVAANETMRAWLKEGRAELLMGDKTELITQAPNGPPDDKAGGAPSEERFGNSDPELPEPARKAGKPNLGPSESWRELSNDSRFEEVCADARRIGVDKVFKERSASELLILGDSARLLRDWSLADGAYSSIVERFPGSDMSFTAAFAMGKMAFDQQGMYEKADKWLSTYVDKNGSGPLAQEALFRLVEARKRIGDEEGAKTAARRYLSAYPNGPYASAARTLAGVGEATAREE